VELLGSTGGDSLATTPLAEPRPETWSSNEPIQGFLVLRRRTTRGWPSLREGDEPSRRYPVDVTTKEV
jgi:hypothetical protein